MKRFISKASLLRPFGNGNGETKCYSCGAWCQGIKAFDGHIYCPDCYKKYFG